MTPDSTARSDSALQGVTSAPLPEGWMPIETAPRDGTHILIADAGHVCEARFVEGYADGWYAANNDPTDHWGGPLLPTHWMPLPPAPQVQP